MKMGYVDLPLDGHTLTVLDPGSDAIEDDSDCPRIFRNRDLCPRTNVAAH